MFTWICPQCGREVPPAYNECPNCAGKPGQAPPPQPGQSAPMAAPPPAYQQAPPPAYQQQPPAYQQAPPAYQQAPPPTYQQAPAYPQPAPYPPVPGFMQAPPPASGISLPPWLMSIGFAALFLAVGAALFFGIKHFSGSGEASASAPPAALEKALPSAAASKGGQANMLQKYVEVVGVRLTEDSKQKPEVRFVVINHSGAEISDLAANVNLWARTAKSDEEAIGTFTFKLPTLGPYDSKDMSGPLNTKLRVYELPDWQNLTSEVQITSPR